MARAPSCQTGKVRLFYPVCPPQSAHTLPSLPICAPQTSPVLLFTHLLPPAEEEKLGVMEQCPEDLGALNRHLHLSCLQPAGLSEGSTKALAKLQIGLTESPPRCSHSPACYLYSCPQRLCQVVQSSCSSGNERQSPQ